MTSSPFWGLTEWQLLHQNVPVLDGNQPTNGQQIPGAADGVMDWAVGQFVDASDQALAGQAAAFTTTRAGWPSSYWSPGTGTVAPNPMDCPDSAVSGLVDPGCKPDPSAVQNAIPSQSLYFLPSYPLSGFAMTDDGTGWAVGERGAIMKLEPSAAAGSSSGGGSGESAQVGQAHPTPFGDSSAYDAFASAPSASGEVGQVPPLSAQPVENLDRPQLVPYGSPEPHPPDGATPELVHQIVMSRDGSEGWALDGANRQGDQMMTLYHYTHGTWSRCDTDGIAGVLPADPACASLAQLRVPAHPGDQPLTLVAAARIPMENGGDPARANDFVVEAIGSIYHFADGTSPTVLLRYEGGRWRLDRQAMAQLGQSFLGSIAYTAPDDGWIGTNSGVGDRLFHFDGTRWFGCQSDLAACGDDPSNPRLPYDLAGTSSNTTTFGLASAGNRVYLYGTRASGLSTGAGSGTLMIIYHDRGRDNRWTDGAGGQGGGYDPGWSGEGGTSLVSAGSSVTGTVTSLSVAQDRDGHYFGWASAELQTGTNGYGSGRPGMLRLASDASGHGNWSIWPAGDAISDYGTPGPPELSQYRSTGVNDGGQSDPVIVSYVTADGRQAAAYEPETTNFGTLPMPPMSFDGSKWVALPSEFSETTGAGYYYYDGGTVRTMAPDNQGGLWLAVRVPPTGVTDFYRYTTQVPKPVFTDISHPVRDPVAGLTGGPNGSVWVATQGDHVYRYDRVSGWNDLRVQGWTPGFATVTPPAYAIAVGADGRGVLVGKSGRIADLSSAGAVLDSATGLLCPQPAGTACGTSQSLWSAAVAPNGSALVGGDQKALLYRSATGPFHAIDAPPAPSGTTFTGISMPRADQAWVTDDRGEVFGGTLGSGGWQWALQDTDSNGDLLSLDRDGTPQALRAIAIDGNGHGYAVGDRGVVLERSPHGRWQRLATGFLNDLTAVALPPGGGPGALIGGEDGLILTLWGDRFFAAREADHFDPLTHTLLSVGPHIAGTGIVGLALLAGDRPGQVEAWAAQQNPWNQSESSSSQQVSPDSDPVPGHTALLHYSSDPRDPLLSAGATVAPLPDTPPVQPGELSLAAFGKSDCQSPNSSACPEFTGTGLIHEVLADRIADDLVAQSRAPGGPALALFTGDATDVGGGNGIDAAANSTNTALDTDVKHRRWAEAILGRFADAGVSVFGALGSQDLSHSQVCTAFVALPCAGTRASAVGLSLPWRQALAGQAAPWGATGSAPPPDHNGFSFRPLGDGAPEGPAVSTPAETVPAPAETTPSATVTTPGMTTPSNVPSETAVVPGETVGGDQTVTSQTISTAGAHTHYAFDVERRGAPVLRVVVVDTSLKTLATAAGEENPVESQLKWLLDVLSSRPPGERAVVVSETPSYSYGPGQGTDTLTDSPVFEALMLQQHVSAVISGRLGWNGVYYTFAPGVHCPQPGQSQPDPDHPPAAPADCAGGAAQAQSSVSAAENQLAQTLVGTGAPASPGNLLSSYATVIAASAGGKFGPADQPSSGSAADGYWHGYSIIRIEHDGAVIVEQRPVFDWIGIDAIAHQLQPGQHMQLHGYGREPVGMDAVMQYDDINSPAITHRFDLVRADPAHPWLPLVDAASPAPNHYVPLDPSVATINRETGFVQTGSGSHPLVYAIAILSVGNQAAAWTLAFQPRRDFVNRPGVLPQLPPVIPPAQVPPAHLAAAAPAPPPPPSSAPPTPPEVASPNLPQLPSLSPPPPVAAVTPPTPPPPPAPPPPPSQPTPLPLALQAKLSPVGINATVVPPSPPPVNPAPPSGSAARKEAKQKQAATAKSEEGGEARAQDAAGDLADSPPGGTGTVHPATRISGGGQPSAWTRDLLYGGSLSLAALILALGFTVVRPGPRRREPRLPAPAWNRFRRW